MAKHLAVGLVVLSVLVALSAAEAHKRVNLIFPQIRRAQIDLGWNASVSLWTRAAQYQIVNFDLKFMVRGSLVRVGDWTEPKGLIEQGFYNGTSGERPQQPAQDTRKGLEKYQISSGRQMLNGDGNRLLLCEAYTKFNGSEGLAGDVCFRDNEMRGFIGTYEFKKDLWGLHTLPSSAVGAALEKAGNVEHLNIFLFDISGAATFFTVEFDLVKQDSRIDKDSIKNWLISSIDAPAIHHNKTIPGWLDKSSLIKENLTEQLKDNIDFKTRSAYVQSIAQFKGTLPEPYVCFYHGPIKPPINCWSQGSDFKQDYNLGDPDSHVIIHAEHRETDNERDYTHIAYSLKSTQIEHQVRYIYCSHYLVNPIPILLDAQPQNNTNCAPSIITTPPNDIIGFEHDKCSKTIAFYDAIYTVHGRDESIWESTSAPKVLDGLDFYVNAAHAVNNTIYFFTGANTLVIVDGSMDDKCETLFLNFNQKKVMRSQDYLYPLAFQKPGEKPIQPPYIFDYREIAEGANDTSPPIKEAPPPWTPAPIPPSTPSPRPDPKPQPKEGTSVVIIAAGLILGGLIIAAIVYMFCLRGSSDEPAALGRLKSKRAKTPVGLETGEAISSMKTVRSEHAPMKSPARIGSKIGPLATKSRGSMRSRKGKPKSTPTAGASAPSTTTIIVASKPKSSSPTAFSPDRKSPRSPKSLGRSSKKSLYTKSPKAAKTLVADP